MDANGTGSIQSAVAGVPADPRRSVASVFECAAALHRDEDFLHVPAAACRDYSSTSIRLTYRQTAERAAALAHRFRLAGFGPGHRVALALDNRPEFFLHFLALTALGTSIVPVNAAMSIAELASILWHADIALAVTHEGHAAHLRAALPPGTALHIVSLRDECPPPAERRCASPDEVALLYTSGTMGNPKGCILTNEYFVDIGDLYTGLGGYCTFRHGDRLATPLPVTHMNALACSLMAMLMTGGCLIQLDRFHPSNWWQSLRTSGATAFHYLGVMPAMLLNAPQSTHEHVAGALRFGFGAGAQPQHHAAFEARFGVPLIEAWAMTETGAGAWITANHEPRHVGTRCFGRPAPGLEYRLVRDAVGSESSAAGELLVRRSGAAPRRGFFSGYYNDDVATDQAWAGGWFHTGDIVHIGGDGSFFFVDRLKNIIRRSGENIAAIEVESTLQMHPDVLASAVCPVADDIRGEEVFAFVILRETVSCSKETALLLQAHCLGALAYYKAPGYLSFCADLPQTASQKFARARIKMSAIEAIQAGRAFDLRQLKRRTPAAV